MHVPHLILAAAAALTLTLAGCSASEPTTDSDGFNDADARFATAMIQHHAQALEMVDLTMGRDLEPEMVELTEQIRAAQAPEIEQMADWLVEWDQPVPQTSRDHANAHGDGGAMDEQMPGMMSAEEMAALEDAPDQRFADMWLEMMVEHHEGAVEMAQTEIEDGQDPRAIALADEIVSAQEDEIATMRDMLED
jgi:uncharacterized protein (DUF305 family)